MTPPSLRQVRSSFIQSLVWRDLHFLLRLRGRDACLLGDSSPWGDNTEITSFQVCWLDADGSLSMYPIHVTVECGKTAHVLYLSLLRQMAYWKTLSNHLVELGLLSRANTFSLDCVASMFTDRGSVLGCLRGMISKYTNRSILHLYELLHRVHIVDEAIAKCLSPGI